MTITNCSLAYIESSNTPINKINLDSCKSYNDNLLVDVSFTIFAVGIMSFVSWFLLVLFGGVGLPALPLDLIYEFISRPKKITLQELENNKNLLAAELRKNKEIALELKKLEDDNVLKSSMLSKERRDYEAKLRSLQASMMIIDKQYQTIVVQSDINDEWVLHYYFCLILGIISIVISILWVVQM